MTELTLKQLEAMAIISKPNTIEVMDYILSIQNSVQQSAIELNCFEQQTQQLHQIKQ